VIRRELSDRRHFHLRTSPRPGCLHHIPAGGGACAWPWLLDQHQGQVVDQRFIEPMTDRFNALPKRIVPLAGAMNLL